MFRYYKFEAENPFNNEKQNAQFQYWSYEQLFEDKFNAGNFSAEVWIPPNVSDEKEWESVLSGNPINKEELFKLWLFHLLMERLPEKYQTDKNHFIRLYWDSENNVSA